jgi:glutathione synthase/RimK-type ligase-like ATP-grasp enzyme
LILVVTHSQDISADLVIRHLAIRNAHYCRLDTDRLGTPQCFFGFRSEPELVLGNTSISASEISTIWARRFALPKSIDVVDPNYQPFVRNELSAVMTAFLDYGAAVQVNPHWADLLAGNRLIQAMRANKVGLKTPASVVTQRVSVAREFIDSHDAVITKAISFGRLSSSTNNEKVVFCSAVPKDSDLGALNFCPTLFQEAVPKRFDWRVTTIGDRAFAARAPVTKSDASLDWRKEPNDIHFEPAQLPQEIEARLLALCEESQIVYGAHDFIETPSGDFIFLETNPAGQWGWLELSLRLPIGEAIAEELLRRSKG